MPGRVINVNIFIKWGGSHAFIGGHETKRSKRDRGHTLVDGALLTL